MVVYRHDSKQNNYGELRGQSKTTLTPYFVFYTPIYSQYVILYLTWIQVITAILLLRCNRHQFEILLFKAPVCFVLSDDTEANVV